MAMRKERLRKLREAAENLPPPPCPACGGQIVIEEIDENGVSTFPTGGPCEVCGSASAPPREVARLEYTVELREDRDDDYQERMIGHGRD